MRIGSMFIAGIDSFRWPSPAFVGRVLEFDSSAIKKFAESAKEWQATVFFGSDQAPPKGQPLHGSGLAGGG